MLPASRFRASTLEGYGGYSIRPGREPASPVPESGWEDEAPPYVESREEDSAFANNPLRPSASRQSNASASRIQAGSRPTFNLNGKELATPLVSVQAVKDHLLLLASFWQLKQDVIAHKQPELEDAGISDEDRWAIFLVKAHLRFIVWLICRTCEPEHCTRMALQAGPDAG
jgi:hypothetical protein